MGDDRQTKMASTSFLQVLLKALFGLDIEAPVINSAQHLSQFGAWWTNPFIKKTRVCLLRSADKIQTNTHKIFRENCIRMREEAKTSTASFLSNQ